MTRSRDAVAATGGGALALLMRAILVVRRPRPIHSTGLVLDGVLRWRPRTTARSGVGWIDDRVAGERLEVAARYSRGAGLPAPLPDVLGLALRIPAGDGPADLLLSSAWLGVPGRYALRPRWTPTGSRFSTIMPFRGSRGPVLVAALTRRAGRLPARTEALREALLPEPWVLDLAWAHASGRWHRFAEVVLTPRAGALDTDTLRFDPVLHAPPGAGTYAWARLLREPSYARARLGRP